MLHCKFKPAPYHNPKKKTFMLHDWESSIYTKISNKSNFYYSLTFIKNAETRRKDYESRNFVAFLSNYKMILFY